MSARHPPSSHVRSPARRWWLGGLAALALLVVAVLLLGGGDDDPKLTFVDGAPDKGFPLRGNLAGDDAAIKKAGEAWLADDAREDEDDRVLDHDDDVEMTALWAGRIGNNEVVVLAEDRHAALVTRRVDRDGAFSVHGVRPIRDAEDPRLVVFGPAILVDRRAEAAFAPAGVRPSPGVAPTDGLWTTRGDYAATSEVPDGALTIRNGLPGYSGERTPPVAAVVSDQSSVWQVDDALMAKLLAGPQAFSPPAYQRLVAATALEPREDGRENWDRYATTPPELRLIQDQALPVLGRTMVLTAELRDTGDRRRILAATGGSTVAGKDEAQALPLYDDERGETSGGDPPLAAAIVDRATATQPYRDASVFVAGSRAIRSIEVLSGTERTVRPGPVAVVGLPEASAKEPPRSLGDIAVIGRTRNGTVVVPGAIAR